MKNTEQDKSDIDMVAQGMSDAIKNKEEPAKKKTLKYLEGDKLQGLDLPPVEFVVENLFPIGLNLIASPPKYGKSFLVLDLCLSVATGSNFLGFKTNKADCLYLALEDSFNRLKERMNKVLDGKPAPSGFVSTINASNISNGLIEELTTFLTDKPNTKLIVIDTFQKIRCDGTRGQSAYATDYNQMDPLKKFADQNKICILLVHHTKKDRDVSDVFGNISGTQGIFGSCDTVVVLSKEDRTDSDTKMSVVGRDIEMNEYQMQFDKEKCKWKRVGTTEEFELEKARREYEANPIVATIKKLLSIEPMGWSGTSSNLLEAGKTYAGCYLADSANALGKQLNIIEKPLFEFDYILHKVVKNGSGGKKHSFYYGYNPFEKPN